MKTGSMRFGLSLMVVLSLWASRLPAQTVAMAPGGEMILVVPTVPYEPAHQYPGGVVPGPRVPPHPASHRLQYLFNQHGTCCQSNAPWGACGNFHYDFNFIFGSCRSFFSEPCYPNIHPGHKHHPR